MNRIDLLCPLVRTFYQNLDPAHDWAHIQRVVKNVIKLSENLEVNLSCAMAAAYCHDLVNLPKNHPERTSSSSLSADKAEPILLKVGFDIEEIKIIKKAIIEHSYSTGLKPSSLEAQIVQDADRLDALGAIGVLRCAAVNVKMNSQFYNIDDPLAERRDLDDKSFMLDHYYTKLLKLPDVMNTPQGKSLAFKRVEFMKRFIEELMNEIHH